ncbi:MAG: hypothetical protein ABW123_00470 [Cystobacter sp.]
MLTLAVLGSACPGGTSGDGGGNLTLEALPEAQRAAFEAWKARPFKACHWAEAFPELAKEAPGRPSLPSMRSPLIDLSVLSADLPGLPLVQGEQGDVLIFEAPIFPSSGSRDQAGYTGEVVLNGRTTWSVSVESVRDGGTCVVTLDGAEVFRAEVVESMPIRAHADAESLGGAGADLSAPVLDPTHTLGALDSAPLLQHTLDALIPDERTHAMLAKRWGLEVSLVRALFPLVGSHLPVVIRPRLADTPEFAPQERMYGPWAAIEPFEGATRAGFDLLFLSPRASSELLVVHAEVATEAGGRNARTLALTVAPSIERTDTAAVTCFKNRLRLASAFYSLTPHSPSFDAVLYNCGALSSEPVSRDSLLGDSAIQRLIARITFTGPLHRETRFSGWDTLFMKVIERLVASGTELATLDSEQEVPALDAALTRATSWSHAVPASAPASLRRTVLENSLRWSLRGEALPEEFPALFPQALTHAGTDCADSLRLLMQDVTREPSSAVEAARCGAKLVGDRAARVSETLGHAAALPEAALYTHELKTHLLQRCPGDAELSRIDGSIALAGAFATADKARGTTTGREQAVGKLVDQALREAWTAETYAALEPLLALGVARHALCESGGDSSSRRGNLSQQMRCLIDQNMRLGVAAGELLHPALVTRHADFARDWLPLREGWLSEEPFLPTRARVEGRFFLSRLWQQCSDAGFEAARSDLFRLLEELKVAAPAERSDIERSISTRVGAATCP